VPIRVIGVVGVVVGDYERIGGGAVLDDDFPMGVVYAGGRRFVAEVVAMQGSPPGRGMAHGVMPASCWL